VIDSNFGKVAVLCGGRSAEREISLQSGRAVLTALCNRGVDAHHFDPVEQPLEALLEQGFDRAYVALHGRYGEDGTVQGALELMALPYTGSGVMASALAMDKWRTKLLWQTIGIHSPQGVVVRSESELAKIPATLTFPLIVKPLREGSTIGLSKILQEEDLPAAYQCASDHDSLILIEEFIKGTELTAAILDEKPLPLVRVEVAGELYDYQAKYLSDDTRYFCPSGLSDEKTSEIQSQALEAYKILGCRGWGRVDLILSESGVPYFLEANTSPGMTSHSLVPLAAKAAGISFEELVLKILALSDVE